MSLRFADPGALWLLLALPLVWLVARVGRTNFNGRQRHLQAAVRASLLATLVVAFARPVALTESSRTSVVYLVDVSHSIASRAITAAADRIDTLNREFRPDNARIVAFGGRASTQRDTSALRALASETPRAGADPMGRDGSDLEQALAEARAELRTGDQPRLVLFSDGRATGGDAEAATLRLASEGIPVFVEPMFERDLGDSFVDALDVPDLIATGAPVTVVPVLWSQRARPSVTVEVRDGTRLLASTKTTLKVGENRVPLDVTFDRAGAHLLTASLAAPDDPLAVNNRLDREVIVKARTRVLYVESTPASATYLEHALTQAGFDVAVRAPSALPTRLEELAPWDVVILSDVARAAIPAGAAQALSTWVAREGGGLFMAGGESVFGEGKDPTTGYRGSEIEALLPVTVERKDEPDVALVMVLDKSWSMAGTVMELCKAAAQAAVDALDDRQTVGVLTFDDRLRWDVTPRNVGANRDAIRAAITAIQPGGDTLIYPALEQAYIELRKVRASAKHVVLLSDGRSYPDDYQGLAKKMVAAGMTVSSIAVGRDADADLLGKIAGWGKGRGYVVLDAKQVAQIFVKEARSAMPAFEEGARILPVVKARSVLAHVDLSQMPGLRGRTAMVLKTGATEVLATDKDDPLLAWWPIGRGRSAVFASDVKDRWASDWVRWANYGPFFAAVVHAIARERPVPLALGVSSRLTAGGLRVVTASIEARDGQDRYRDGLKPIVRVQMTGGASLEVSARQVEPGRYEATITADRDQPLTVAVSESGGAPAETRLVVPDPNAEYRLRPPDVAGLRAIATGTGGVFQPSPEDLRRPAVRRQATTHEAWPWLVLLACVLWPLDLLLRRVRLFEGGGRRGAPA
jgi:Ca-activated chloride channel homolog